MINTETRRNGEDKRIDRDRLCDADALRRSRATRGATGVADGSNDRPKNSPFLRFSVLIPTPCPPSTAHTMKTQQTMLTRTLIALVFTVVLAAPALAQSTIFLVRHAERADTATGAKPTMAADPELSEAGRARAESLADVLRDANITAIFATEFKRTQQTAAPLAKALGLKVRTASSKNNAALLKELKAAKSNVLVVGHSSTIPEIINGLGVKTPVKIGDADFDNLFVVLLGVRPGAQPEMIRLHYR
jgi:broad specificity phosphatase PhoE